LNIELLRDKKVLYVEDDKSIVNSFMPIFKKIFKEILTAQNGEDGYYLFRNNQDIDFVITDIKMPRMNGLDMCNAIKKLKPDVPCFITTAHAERDYILKADVIGVYKYITKPLNVQELISALAESIEKKN
jgi:YesN/AraC family two-component response regulator